MFQTFIGYTMVAMILAKCTIYYSKVLMIISRINDIVYSSGSHAFVEYTNEQRELMEKLKIEL